MKKHAFTLMEVLVALSISTIIVGSIFSALYQQSASKHRYAIASKCIMNRARIHQCLGRMLLSLDSYDTSLKAIRSPLYTNDNGEVVMRFDASINPHLMEFSGVIEGVLGCHHGKLQLTLLGDGCTHTQCLSEGVSAWRCEFLSCEDGEMVVNDSWSISNPQLPICLRLIVNDINYVFRIYSEHLGVPLY